MTIKLEIKVGNLVVTMESILMVNTVSNGLRMLRDTII